MRPHLFLVTCALTLATLTPPAAAHPAAARPATPGARLTHMTKPAKPTLTTHPKSRKDIRRALLLATAKGESPTPADHAVLLQCSAPGGTHPHPADACRLLDPVNADLNELNADPKAKCTREYDPVTVYASGLWDTQRLSYEHTFPNPCELRATMGAVFDLGAR
ncbi:SSI family serine proteinase inhibitor [Sphaerisporangium sp. B11E5]|uniref:SSI family serine proteinase inhibitor n=1 Tax=Sphaerisporangium sp. B11E5 TaxID=3153563 RepID=UPI00325E7387